MAYLLSALSLNACVAIDDAENWRPETDYVGRDFDQCFSQSPPAARAVFYGKNTKAQCRALAACMQAHGYQVRSESPFEMIADLILSPIYFIGFTSGVCYKLGTGKSTWPYTDQKKNVKE